MGALQRRRSGGSGFEGLGSPFWPGDSGRPPRTNKAAMPHNGLLSIRVVYSDFESTHLSQRLGMQ